MPNIRLTNGYKWTTDGVYDTAQSKAQNVINSEIADVVQNNANLILMQSTQPSATGNNIWIKEGISYQIPVVEDLADTFDSTVTYSVGQLCTYEGSMYRCTTSHTGTWDASHFSLTKLGSEIDSLKAADASLQGSITPIQNDLAIIVNGKQSALGVSKGQYVLVKNSTISGIADGIYSASKAIPANTNIDSTYLTSLPNGALNSVFTDSGWTNVTYESGFKTYGAGTNPVKYRKINGIVNLIGLLSTTEELSAGGHTICYLPDGFRPSVDFVSVCQGSGMNKWAVTISKQGVVYADRYGIDTSLPFPSGVYLPINVLFFSA